MGSLSNEALSGYVMERQRILDKLDELGLLEYATESDGTQVPVPIMGSMFVVCTDIAGISANGGNVIINAGSLKGTGTIDSKVRISGTVSGICSCCVSSAFSTAEPMAAKSEA